MKPMPKTQLCKLMTLLLAGMLLLACAVFPPAAASNSTPAAAKTGQPAGNNPPDETAQAAEALSSTDFPTPQPDPLDRLLGMRSIKIELNAVQPDGKSRTLSVEIDSAGNMHVREGFPGLDAKDLPKDVDPKTILNGGKELFVLAGKAYQADPQNPDWKTTPVDADFKQSLTNELHSADGPALWLDVLPEGSIHAAGKDNVGGFAADKYAVSGQINGQTLSGTIWFEPKADALIQADLSVPAALLGGKTQAGVLKISLKTQQANIPAVKLPDIQMATAVPTTAP